MSGFGISEFEDSLWDEFFQFDQMVPNDGLECSNDHFPWHDNLRYTLCEVNCNSSHSENGSVSRCAHLGRKQGGCSSLHDKCSSMSDTDSWSCKRSAMFPFSSESDLMDESSSVAFDDTRSSCCDFKINSADSQGGNFPENVTYLADRRTPVDNQSETTHQESSFDSFENIDSADFFSGVCPDVQSFEDVEMLFRSPDSAFGVGVDKDELSWLSPDNDEGGFGFEFSCAKSSMDANMSVDRDSLKSYLADDPVMSSAPIKFGDSSCTLGKSDSNIPFVIVPAIVADSKDGFIPRHERVGINDTLHPSISTNSRSKTNSGGAIDEPKKQYKPLNQLKGIRKKHNSGKDSCRNLSNLPIKFIQLHSAATSYEDPSAHLQPQQKQALGLLNRFSSAPLEKSNLPDQTSANQSPSAVKSGIEEIEKQHNNQGNQSSVNNSLKDANIMEQTYENGSPSVEKQVHLCGDKIKDTIDADGVSVVNPSKLGSSIVQESSTRSLDEISPEAASFCQLQLVMEWLDFRTRLSIRDGLYRLAQGAEQRHDHVNLCYSSGDGKTSSGLLIAEETNKGTRFPNMEAGSNPIDRSIAHLLFHRPSNSCAIPAHD
ncbi:uncharacterized protein [Primulina huaijiensis]|uniref:uncharacterized protein isoform X4 n=1 Tax=Primulina huaijiensis TaxID=1492673 RepID=UPI003CC7265D